MAPPFVVDIIMKDCGAPTVTHTNHSRMDVTGSNPLAAVGAPVPFASKTPHHCRSSSVMMIAVTSVDSFDLSFLWKQLGSSYSLLCCDARVLMKGRKNRVVETKL